MKLLNIKGISIVALLLSSGFYLYCRQQTKGEGALETPPLPQVQAATLWCRYKTAWGFVESAAGLDKNKNIITFPANDSLYSWACNFECPHYLNDTRTIYSDIHFAVNDTPNYVVRSEFEQNALNSCKNYTPHEGEFVEYGIRSETDLQPFLFHKPFFENVPKTIPADSLPFSRIVVFGDSISDTGNFWDVSGHAILQWPYFIGRFSNGPVWVDYLVEDINKQQSSPVDLYNYSVGGSAAVTGGYNYAYSNLDTQMDQYLNEVENLSKFQKGGVYLNPGYDKTLYTIFIGTNDYMVLSTESNENLIGLCGVTSNDIANAGLALTAITEILQESWQNWGRLDDPSFERMQKALNALSSAIAQPCVRALITGEGRGILSKTRGIKNNIKNVIAQATDIKKFFFLLPTEPDMTLLPYYNYHGVPFNPLPPASIYEILFVKLLSAEHNKLLDALKTEIRNEYASAGIEVQFLNLKLDEILNGFANDTAGDYFKIVNEIEIKDKINACFTGSALSLLPSTNFCPQPEGRLFWDQVHPATATHCAIAKLALKQMYEDLKIAHSYTPEYGKCRGSAVVNPIPIASRTRF